MKPRGHLKWSFALRPGDEFFIQPTKKHLNLLVDVRLIVREAGHGIRRDDGFLERGVNVDVLLREDIGAGAALAEGLIESGFVEAFTNPIHEFDVCRICQAEDVWPEPDDVTVLLV